MGGEWIRQARKCILSLFLSSTTATTTFYAHSWGIRRRSTTDGWLTTYADSNNASGSNSIREYSSSSSSGSSNNSSRPSLARKPESAVESVTAEAAEAAACFYRDWSEHARKQVFALTSYSDLWKEGHLVGSLNILLCNWAGPFGTLMKWAVTNDHNGPAIVQVILQSCGSKLFTFGCTTATHTLAL